MILLDKPHGALLVIMQHVMLTACGAEVLGKQLAHASVDPLVTSCSLVHYLSPSGTMHCGFCVIVRMMLRCWEMVSPCSQQMYTRPATKNSSRMRASIIAFIEASTFFLTLLHPLQCLGPSLSLVL